MGNGHAHAPIPPPACWAACWATWAAACAACAAAAEWCPSTSTPPTGREEAKVSATIADCSGRVPCMLKLGEPMASGGVYRPLLGWLRQECDRGWSAPTFAAQCAIGLVCPIRCRGQQIAAGGNVGLDVIGQDEIRSKIEFISGEDKFLRRWEVRKCAHGSVHAAGCVHGR